MQHSTNSRLGATYAPLLLRVTLGSLFIAHLCWKFTVFPGGLAAGAELPILWGVLLILQFLLGRGPYALSVRKSVPVS